MASDYRWSVTLLTVPERAEPLRRTLRSLNDTVLPGDVEVVIVYNARPRGTPAAIERAIQELVPRLPVSVHFNRQDPSIGSGRACQLDRCRGDLVCFIDDDVTLHGPVFPTIEDHLQRLPLGLVGLRSYTNNTTESFKPRPELPHVDRDGFRFTPVQGLLIAGYRNLFEDAGGFNPRRRFWGEWTELNLRLWRLGYPTGYPMTGAFLRHWLDAPGPPTRDLPARDAHVLWDLICTALEYDAVDAGHATEAFWRLVERRALSRSSGEDLSRERLLRTTLELMPAISAEWPSIARFRDQVSRHPFAFKPFHPLSDRDVDAVLTRARGNIERYRRQVWPVLAQSALARGRGWLRGMLMRWRYAPGTDTRSASDGPGEPFRH